MTEKTSEARGLAGAAPRAPLKPANPALRMPSFDEEDDDIDAIIMANKPDGMTYEWKRYSSYGKIDTKYQAQLQRRGWVVVPASRHRDYFGDVEGGAIDNDRILMERPEEWTRQSRKRELEKAQSQVLTQQQRLKIATHDAMPRERISQRRTYERVEVPADDVGDPNDL